MKQDFFLIFLFSVGLIFLIINVFAFQQLIVENYRLKKDLQNERKISEKMLTEQYQQLEDCQKTAEGRWMMIKECTKKLEKCY